MVGLDDLKCVFQPKWSYESIASILFSCLWEEYIGRPQTCNSLYTCRAVGRMGLLVLRCCKELKLFPDSGGSEHTEALNHPKTLIQKKPDPIRESWAALRKPALLSLWATGLWKIIVKLFQETKMIISCWSAVFSSWGGTNYSILIFISAFIWRKCTTEIWCWLYFKPTSTL